MKKIQKLVVWIRRELRVDDHLALWSAVQDAVEVIPLFIVEDDFRSLAPAKQKVTIEALTELRFSLRNIGGDLFIRSGDPMKVIHQFLRESSIAGVYATREYHPARREKDQKLKSSVEHIGRFWKEFKDHVIYDGKEILTSSGSPYVVYSAYRRAWLTQQNEITPPLPRMEKVASPDIEAGEIPILTLNGQKIGTDKFPIGGEKQAYKESKRFLEQKVGYYHEQRDLPGHGGTSRISHHLASGSLSIRTLYNDLAKSAHSTQGLQKQGVDVFLNELIWREFYYQILANYPHVVTGSFKTKLGGLPWSRNEEHEDAWRSGQTGYPIVDAAMRQLVTEGWMHNRCRMIVANFLVKDLHINWQVGEEYFMQHLADGDVALNNGGWQWCAGTGTDAQPWFRILNPILQSKRFDPHGEYLRTYVPELNNVSDKYIHEPWLMPVSVQREAGVLIGKHYPMPIVDHEQERRHTLNIFGKINKSNHHHNNHK